MYLNCMKQNLEMNVLNLDKARVTGLSLMLSSRLNLNTKLITKEDTMDHHDLGVVKFDKFM